MAENDIHVLGYAEPAKDPDAPISGYEMVVAAQAQGLIDKQLWYIEADAREQAAELAGRPVKLPYFFIGDAPEEGKAWPAHRCGGLRFMKKWIAGRAAAKGAEAPAPEAVEDHPADAGLRVDVVEEKLKAERKTTRALRRELKELQEHAEGVERVHKATAERNETQAQTINGLNKRNAEQSEALRQVHDRVRVALGWINRIALAGSHAAKKRDHIAAELTSARELIEDECGLYAVSLGGAISSAAEEAK